MRAFDIETGRDDRVRDLYKPVQIDGRLTDIGKRAADEMRKRAEQELDASLDRWACRIVALAMRDMETGEQHVLICRNDKEEAHALKAFWAFMQNQDVVGYNCRTFDLPIIVARSLRLNVPFAWAAARPHILRTGKHIHDLYELVTMGQFVRDSGVISRSLTSMCKVFGIDVPESDIDGAQIGDAVRAGQWDLVREHVTLDLERTVQLAQRLRIRAAVTHAPEPVETF